MFLRAYVENRVDMMEYVMFLFKKKIKVMC